LATYKVFPVFLINRITRINVAPALDKVKVWKIKILIFFFFEAVMTYINEKDK